jgi:hypothetical protein
MLIRRLIFAINLLLACMAMAEEPQAFEYGPRPPLAVFDPASVLDPPRIKELSDTLTTIFKNEGVDVLVVVLTDLKGAPPEHVARRFAKAWCQSPIHAVVLHVPGRQDSPWIIPLGRLLEAIKPEQVKESVANAQRRASRETNDTEKVRTAANEAADFLRYWTQNVFNRSEILLTEQAKLQLEQGKRSRSWRIATLVGIAALVPFLAGISFLVTRLRKGGPRIFPATAHQPRLGAPHAGGNHLIAELAAPKS